MQVTFKLNVGAEFDDLPSDVQSAVRANKFRPEYYAGSLSQGALDDLKSSGLASSIEVTSIQQPSVISLDSVSKWDSSELSSNTSGNASWAIAEACSKTNRLTQKTTNDVLCDIGALGEGVDLVYRDGDVAVPIFDHPEWISEKTGTSRFVQFDWTTLNSGFTQPSDYYSTRNTNLHGTAGLSVAAGRLYGFAKEATLYALGSHSDPDLWDFNEGLDLVKEFHLNKSDKSRPTVLVLNLNLAAFFDPSLYNRVRYQGEEYTVDLTTTSGREQAVSDYKLPINIVDGSTVLIQSVQLSGTSLAYKIIKELTDLGVTVVYSSGNQSQYIDNDGGEDWDNQLFNSSTNDTLYYNRTIANNSNGAVSVGAVDTTMVNGKYRQADFSNRGPGIHLYGPGEGVPSATLNSDTSASAVDYPLNSGYKSRLFNGTSSAGPLVGGIAACIAGARPELKGVGSLVIGAAVANRVDPGSDNMLDERATFNALNKFATHPYGAR